MSKSAESPKQKSGHHHHDRSESLEALETFTKSLPPTPNTTPAKTLHGHSEKYIIDTEKLMSKLETLSLRLEQGPPPSNSTYSITDPVANDLVERKLVSARAEHITSHKISKIIAPVLEENGINLKTATPEQKQALQKAITTVIADTLSQIEPDKKHPSAHYTISTHDAEFKEAASKPESELNQVIQGIKKGSQSVPSPKTSFSERIEEKRNSVSPIQR